VLARIGGAFARNLPKIGIGGTALTMLFAGDHEEKQHEDEASARAHKTEKDYKKKLAKKYEKGSLTEQEALDLVRGVRVDAKGVQHDREFSYDEEQRRIKKLRFGPDAGEVSGAGGIAGDVYRNIFDPNKVVDENALYGDKGWKPKSKRPKKPGEIGYQPGDDASPQTNLDSRDVLKGLFGYEVKPKENIVDQSNTGGDFVKDMVPDLSSAKAIESAATQADKLAISLESLERSVRKIDANVSQLQNVPR
jgi:hypothetical protein